MYRHPAEWEYGPTHVAVRRPKFSVSKSAVEDMEKVKEKKMSRNLARRRDRIRIDSAVLAMH